MEYYNKDDGNLSNIHKYQLSWALLPWSTQMSGSHAFD